MNNKVIKYAVMAVLAVVSAGCGNPHPERTWSLEQSADSAVVEVNTQPQEVKASAVAKVEPMPETAPQTDNHAGKVHSVKYKRLEGSLRQNFNDSNYMQLQAAAKIGVGPIVGLRATYNLQQPLVEISTCEEYHLATLHHSMPYLVPKAEGLLREIGSRFSEAVRERGGGEQRIKVTSVMRTDQTVKRLRRRNGNSVIDSAHRFGTTFDISYTNFIAIDSTYVTSQADMKNVLAEVLYDLRQEGRCYVKYERKQGCFHITTR